VESTYRGFSDPAFLTLKTANELLAALAAKWGVSQASVIELVVRDYAKEQGIE